MSIPLAYDACIECSNLHQVSPNASSVTEEFLEKQRGALRAEAFRQVKWDVEAHTDRWPERPGYVRTGALAQKAMDTCQKCDGQRPAMADLFDVTVMIAVAD